MSARKPFVAAISGIKNSGKTTFLEHLVPVLRARGLRVAVIKHDGHDFTPDVPGTDSFRMRQAGADGVAVYSGHQWMVVRPQPGSLEALIGQFADCDLVLLEGQKASPYPKIELVRGAVSHESVCAPETLLALATDTPARVDGVETIGQLATCQPEMLESLLGKNGLQLLSYARGEDQEAVRSRFQQEPVKSVGNGQTFPLKLQQVVARPLPYAWFLYMSFHFFIIIL